MQSESTSPTPSQPAPQRLYVVVDGQPQGPFDLSQIQARLASGHVSADSLICAEGGSAWIRVQDFLGARAAEALPASLPISANAAPASRASAAKGPAAILFPPSQRIRAREPRTDQTRGWEMGLLIASAVLYFLPWVHFGDITVYSQSGIQAVTGDVEFNPQRGSAEGNPHSHLLAIMKDKGIAAAGLCTLALTCLAVALGTSLMGIARRVTGIASLAAATLLILQGVRGFPVTQDMKAAMAADSARAGAKSLPKGLPPEFTRGHQEVMDMFRSLELRPVYGKWYYIIVGALIFAGVMALLAPRETEDSGAAR